MSRFRTLFEWAVILVPIAIAGFLAYTFLFAAAPAAVPSGLPDGTGGFFQSPLPAEQKFTKNSGDYTFTLDAKYSYVLAGKIVGRHEYPATLPAGIIPLDLAVVNGDLMKKDILPYFTFTMGSHTLEYSYDIPTWTGLTEDYIDEHISNNHLVFLNTTIENQVRQAQVGSCAIIRGDLVDINGTSPTKLYLMKTSTVRNDSYPAGCEIILVQSYTPVAC